MSLIRNFGLFWDKEEVQWGKPKKTGKLLGVHATAKRDGNVDFRNQIAIYAIYDAAFNLVYVGQTGSGDQRLMKRLNNHRTDHISQRWKYFSWFGLCWVKNSNDLSEGAENKSVGMEIALDHLEAISIAISEPRLNLQRGSFGDECEQYFQKKEAEVII
jgi:hypothetical protein